MARPRSTLEAAKPITVWLTPELAAAVERTGLLDVTSMHAALQELIKRGCEEALAWRALARDTFVLRAQPFGELHLTLRATGPRDAELLNSIIESWKERQDV